MWWVADVVCSDAVGLDENGGVFAWELGGRLWCRYGSEATELPGCLMMEYVGSSGGASGVAGLALAGRSSCYGWLSAGICQQPRNKHTLEVHLPQASGQPLMIQLGELDRVQWIPLIKLHLRGHWPVQKHCIPDTPRSGMISPRDPRSRPREHTGDSNERTKLAQAEHHVDSSEDNPIPSG